MEKVVTLPFIESTIEIPIQGPIKISDDQAREVDKIEMAATSAKLAVCDAYDAIVQLEQKMVQIKAKLKRSHENAADLVQEYRETLKRIAKSVGIDPEDPSWTYQQRDHTFTK